MPSFLDTQETSERFGSHIAEFRSLLDAHRIRHGSPEDIFDFAKTLESDSAFRLDLSSMVKAIVQKESEELLLTDMLGILVTSVGGPDFAGTKADITKPNNALMDFLLGTGCWKLFGSPSSNGSRNPMPPARHQVRVEESAMRNAQPAPAIPAASENLDRTALLAVASELRQMLTRLETDTAQVKLQLASIEKRIHKIEHPSGASAARPLPPEPLLRSKAADTDPGRATPPIANSSAVPEPELTNHIRAVFSQHLKADRSQTADDLSSLTYPEEKRRMLPMGVLFVLLAVLAVSLFFTYTEQGRVIWKDVLSRFEAIGTPAGNVPASVASAPAASLASTTRSTTPTTTIQPATPPTSAPLAAAPALSAPAISPVPAQRVAETAPAGTATSNAASNPQPDARPILSSPTMKYVPANVMAGYLLSAPRPEYPEVARMDHIEGSVALQATISKGGSITTLHIIKGPTVLRAAAIDAVRNWRYKPYTIDGRPSDVATTVYVDFSLRPLPAITR